MLSIITVFFIATTLFIRARRNSEPAVPWEYVHDAFLQRGMSYYIAGRFAAIAHEFPVCANLLHHALEMFLKGSLCRSHSKEQLRLIGHNLWRAWVAFKVQYPDPRLPEFDSVVRALDRFERIRYPDEKAMVGMFELFSEHESGFQSHLAKTPPQYKLNLEDVDRVVVLFFEVAQFNPHFYLVSISPVARDALENQNRHLFRSA